MKYTTIDYIKMGYSMALIIFSVIIVTALMFERGTKIAKDVHPVIALIVMWGGIVWMSMVEGGQCSMVGLPPINRDLYKDSHPTTHQITGLGHKGDNLDRYLMGRQFMVIFINFTINLCGAPLALEEGTNVLGLPTCIQNIFLGSGLAMILTVVNIGQLTPQVNASHCMLDYINTHFMTFTLYIALLIEKTGVMHICYAIQYFCYWLAGRPVESNEAPRSVTQAVFFWSRVLFSFIVLVFSLAVTITALFQGQTTMWDAVPNSISVILFFVLMSIVGLLEGMQIAFFSVSKLPANERGDAPLAQKTCQLLFQGEGRNLPGFMCGRQMTVTLCFFVIARVTTLNIEIGSDDDDNSNNIFGVSDSLQRFFNMGFLGAIITTILGSISWQLVASAFPLAFLSNPIVYLFLKIALAIESTGICAGSWFMGMIQKRIFGFQLDDTYIGTPEERAASDKADLSSIKGDEVVEPHLGTNIILNPVGAKEIAVEYKRLGRTRLTLAERRAQGVENIKDLIELAKTAETEAERDAYNTARELESAALQRLNEEEKAAICDDDAESEEHV